MECKSNPEIDEYLYLDAKLLKGGDVAPKNRAPFQDSIVFVIGGGNYIEYQNLVDFIKVRILLAIYLIPRTILKNVEIPAKKHVERQQENHLRLFDVE